jgi:hypothetical protein
MKPNSMKPQNMVNDEISSKRKMQTFKLKKDNFEKIICLYKEKLNVVEKRW